MIEVEEPDAAGIVSVRMSGLVTQSDIDTTTPQLERIIAEQRPALFYVELLGLDGFEPAGLIDEVTLDTRHRGDVSRVAFVVDTTAETWASRFGQFMLGAEETRIFRGGEEADARNWLSRA